MDYEIVTLSEKKAVGLAARTNNSAPDMGAVIGGLWQRFYGEHVYEAINGTVSGKALGIYTDYAGDEKSDYTVLVGYETATDAEQPAECTACVIPAGRYAKFVVKGDMVKAVADFWMKLWEMNLPRSFVCDFEEYQNGEMENAEIHIYISLKG